jgi:hypothetical protein
VTAAHVRNGEAGRQGRGVGIRAAVRRGRGDWREPVAEGEGHGDLGLRRRQAERPRLRRALLRSSFASRDECNFVRVEVWSWSGREGAVAIRV